MDLLTAKDLCIGYEGEPFLRGLNFTVREGEYLCVLGENGSGKSTLMRTLLGLISPRGGSVVFSGGLKQTEIGYLPQQTSVQKDFPASVREVVRTGFAGAQGWRPFLSRTEKRIAEEKMRRLNVETLANRCYRELSGGQQQRVLLARALCATKRLLLLDEPVTGLDPKAAEELYTLIRQLKREENLAVIMITHDPDRALPDADTVLCLDAPVFYGTREAFCEGRWQA